MEKGKAGMKTFVAYLHTHIVASVHGVDTTHAMCRSAFRKWLKGIFTTDQVQAISGGPNVIYFMSLPRLARGIDLP